MASLFSTPKSPPAANIIAAPVITDPSVQAAAAEQAKQSAEAAGRGSTIMTAGLGVAGQPSTDKKVLLGGGNA